MRVSFLIPLYNCLPLTRAMLESLEATLPRDLEHEIILVDDGSTDGTRDWLRTLPPSRCRVVLNERNLGFARANNRGAAHATGELLVLLNNDLVLTPGWLEPLLALRASLAKPGAIGNVQRRIADGEVDHAGIFINAKGKPEHDRRPPFWLEQTRLCPAVTGACLLIDRKLWQELGGFDEAYVNGCEDVDLCLRLRQRGRTNAVSLRRSILHHVSSSPGRKERDEANTRRLTRAWRETLAELGARAWSREYVQRELNAATGFSTPLGSARLLAFAEGLTEHCPPEAWDGIQGAIDRELKRWDALFGVD